MITQQPIAFKKQQCNMIGLSLSWVGYLAGLAYMGYERHWVGGLLWLVLVPCLRLALFRFFASISRFLGYGRIEDKLPVVVNKTRIAVTFYSFFSCPFCPIVLQRLEALQKEMGFTLGKIDVTLKPQVLMSKGVFSVPVVEVGEDRLVGNATTEQLARLIGLALPYQPVKVA
jgi:thiol-disulfide isomerase/thioredoxin